MIKRKDDFVKGITSRGKASAVGDRKEVGCSSSRVTYIKQWGIILGYQVIVEFGFILFKKNKKGIEYQPLIV